MLDKDVVIIQESSVSKKSVKEGVKYHHEYCNNLLKDNILVLENGKLEFSFTIGMSVKYYKGAISAYTAIDLFIGCLKNEFRNDTKEGKASINFEKYYSKPEYIYAEVNMLSHNIDAEDFLERINFLTVVFETLAKLYNEVISDAANNARIIQLATPKPTHCVNIESNTKKSVN